MKKVLTPLLLLVLVLLFGTTWYRSLQAEKYFNAEVVAINKALPEAVRVKTTAYQRHLFAAEAETVVTVAGREFARLHHLIRHYVWGVDMVSTLAPESVLGQQVEKVFPADQLQLVSHINLQGKITSDFDLAALEKSHPYHLVWVGSGDLTAEQFSGHFEINLPVFAAAYRYYDKFRSGRNENVAVLNEQAEQFVGGLVQKGVFVRKDGIFQLDFTCIDGQKRLNGNVL